MASTKTATPPAMYCSFRVRFGTHLGIFGAASSALGLSSFSFFRFSPFCFPLPRTFDQSNAGADSLPIGGLPPALSADGRSLGPSPASLRPIRMSLPLGRVARIWPCYRLPETVSFPSREPNAHQRRLSTLSLTKETDPSP